MAKTKLRKDALTHLDKEAKLATESVLVAKSVANILRLSSAVILLVMLAIMGIALMLWPTTFLTFTVSAFAVLLVWRVVRYFVGKRKLKSFIEKLNADAEARK